MPYEPGMQKQNEQPSVFKTSSLIGQIALQICYEGGRGGYVSERSIR
jgi:hypothetical protein